MRSKNLIKNSVIRKIAFSAIFLSAASLSCGPMNRAKKGESTSGTATSLQGVNSSKQNLFLVYAALKSVSPAGESHSTISRSPELGDNLFLIRFVHTADLRSVSDKAQLSVTYGMPDMPAMGTDVVTATREADGTFKVTLFFSMSGRWQMMINLQDGDAKDEYSFETDVQSE